MCFLSISNRRSDRASVLLPTVLSKKFPGIPGLMETLENVFPHVPVSTLQRVVRFMMMFNQEAS